jgi:hypothetical protein
MSSVPRPSALVRALVAREAVVRKSSDLLASTTTHTTAVEFQGRTISIQIPYYQSVDEVSTVHIARLVKVLGANVMRLYHSILIGQRVLFIGYNHSAADISDIVLSTGISLVFNTTHIFLSSRVPFLTHNFFSCFGFSTSSGHNPSRFSLCEFIRPILLGYQRVYRGGYKSYV